MQKKWACISRLQCHEYKYKQLHLFINSEDAKSVIASVAIPYIFPDNDLWCHEFQHYEKNRKEGTFKWKAGVSGCSSAKTTLINNKIFQLVGAAEHEDVGSTPSRGGCFSDGGETQKQPCVWDFGAC